MRLTSVLNKHGHNLYRWYKYQWTLHKMRPLGESGERAALEKFGVKISDPSEIFTEPYNIAKEEDYFPPSEVIPESMENLHSFSTDFTTLGTNSLPILQNLFTTVLHEDLPKEILDNQKECTENELNIFKNSVLTSHLLDSYQEKLPHIYDPESPYPVKKPRREYGIPVSRRNELLSLGLSECFDSTSKKRLELLCRPHFMKANVMASLRFQNNLAQFFLPCPMLICSHTSLPTFIPPEDTDLFIMPELDEKTKRKVIRKQLTIDTGSPLQQPLPDIFPMSPLAGSKIINNYPELKTKYVTANKNIYPHTVFIHHNERMMKKSQEELTAITLLNLYTHAVAYAHSAGIKIDKNGVLSKPVVIQGLHIHLNRIQPSVFQLHTLGPDTRLVDETERTESTSEGRTLRNLLFYKPFLSLYGECVHNQDCKPEVTHLNKDLLSLMRAMHEI